MGILVKLRFLYWSNFFVKFSKVKEEKSIDERVLFIILNKLMDVLYLVMILYMVNVVWFVMDDEKVVWLKSRINYWNNDENYIWKLCKLYDLIK